MYEMLMYSGDLSFSIKAAEILYSRAKIDDEDFISPYACYYYSHKSNMIRIDQLESVYKRYLNLENDTFGLVKLRGGISKVGYKFKQQVLMFTPTEMDSANWDKFVIRRGLNVPREVHNIRDNTRVNEKEFVFLV